MMLCKDLPMLTFTVYLMLLFVESTNSPSKESIAEMGNIELKSCNQNLMAK